MPPITTDQDHPEIRAGFAIQPSQDFLGEEGA
jgi:hypothetical protein